MSYYTIQHLPDTEPWEHAHVADMLNNNSSKANAQELCTQQTSTDATEEKEFTPDSYNLQVLIIENILAQCHTSLIS